jgi:hypothetical protein
MALPPAREHLIDPMLHPFAGASVPRDPKGRASENRVDFSVQRVSGQSVSPSSRA